MWEKLAEKLSGYKDAVIGNGIYDFLKTIVSIVLGGTVTSASLKISFDILNHPFFNKYGIVIIIIVVLIVILLIIEFYDKKFKHRPSVPDISGNYTVLKREMTFTYGKDISKYELTLNVRSNIKGLNRINGKYTWSGSDAATIKCVTKRCRIIPLTRKDSYIEYEVELGKNYRKGAKFECRVEGEMPDSQHSFIPFFSTRITEETKELIVNICIPPEYGVREITCEELAIVRNINDNSNEQLLDNEGKFRWVIKNPKLFYIYSVRWEL